MPSPHRGAIAAGHPKTVAAGLEMFRSGGNAFDAAIAAMLASWVAEPALTSAGGGGFCLAHTQAGDNVLFDFFTQTPRQKRPAGKSNFYPVLVDFGGVQQEFHVGLGSMAVPGSLDGAFCIHQRFGSLPFRVVAEPAIRYAKQGVEVNEFQQYVFTILQPILTACPEMRRVYAPSGELLQVGDRLFMKEFAATLEYWVAEGPQVFYRGDMAQKLVADCRDRGGHLALADLQHYRTIERKPLSVRYRGRTLLTNPTPSFGGTLIAFSLKLLERIDLQAVELGSQQHVKILTDIMRATNLARNERLDGQIYRQAIADEFLACESLEQYAASLGTGGSKWGSTTHISAIDRDGNAASITASNGEGSSYAIPGTGVMLNNMLGEDDLNPHGFHQWQSDVRLSSMMAPTMVLEGGKPSIVLGSGGSKRIRTAIVQVLSNLLDFGLPVTDAVAAPRLHWNEGVLNIEPGFQSLDINELAIASDETLVQWPQQNMFFGGVHTIARDANGQFVGSGDRRRSGVAAWL
ncbi:gamma-glutamyltransferase [Synechococcus sp. PCC 7336]|uniref:gamma-glutamyltransferase n=1 Tax=Synechococcus sp. PCC 7336 TaxID=195250 RepID=UPI00034C6F90|nr:gamma-glutamyltransferase [Synechococcus sp. PCC 7336]